MGDEGGDLHHLRLLHALGGDRRGADAQTRRHEGTARIIGHIVLVEGDTTGVENVLRLLAGEFGVERPQIDHHHVVVGTTANEAETLLHQGLGQGAGVGDHLPGVLAETGLGGLEEGHRLAGDDVLEWAALPPREDRLVDGGGEGGLAEDRPTAWTAQGLVGGEGDDVGIGHWIGCHPTGDQAGDVGGIEQEQGTDLVGDGLERFRVEAARVAGGAGDDHLRAVGQGQIAHLVHVDALVAGGDLVGHEVVQQAAGVHRRPVGEVAPVVEAEAQHGVAGLEHRLVGAHVGVRAAVGLDVGVVGAEEGLDPLDRQTFDAVDHGVAAVVALARVTLGVLVGEHAADGTHHRRRGEVLAGDQLQPGDLALEFGIDEVEDSGVGGGVAGERHRGLRVWVVGSAAG